MAGLRFSRRTVIAAVDVMEGSIKTHDDLTRCFLKLDQDLAARCGDGTLSNRFNHLIKFTDEDRGNMVEDGTLLQDALVSEAVKRLRPMRAVIPWKKAEPLPSNPDDEAFLRFLELDGFSVTNGILRHTLPADMELPATKDEMTRLLDKHNFPVAKGHLEQALDAHARGDWAAANGQIRTFIDALLDEITERLDASTTSLGSGQRRRAKLAAIGFLKRDLNEWDDKGGGFLNGLIKRLHPHGSHPGLSDDEDSTFRLHVVLLTARLLLTRFDTWGSV
jgi:hypothetical protein